MPWKCPKCPCVNACANRQCISCKLRGIKTVRVFEHCWDSFDDDRVAVQLYLSSKFLRISKVVLVGIINGEISPVTPQEELFARLFNHEKQLVKDMDDGQLASHRSELSRIAFEARARLTAADDETEGRRKKRGQGITRSVESDETATNAINQINKRKGRQSKQDKILDSLLAMGVDREEAIRIVGARNFNSDRPNENNGGPKRDNKPVQIQIPTININPSEPAKPFINPFKKGQSNAKD